WFPFFRCNESRSDGVTFIWADPDEGVRYVRTGRAIDRDLGRKTRTVWHECRAYLLIEMATHDGQDLGTGELNHLLRDGTPSNREGRRLNIAGTHAPAYRTRPYFDRRRCSHHDEKARGRHQNVATNLDRTGWAQRVGGQRVAHFPGCVRAEALQLSRPGRPKRVGCNGNGLGS